MASTARIDELKKKFDENPRRYFAPLANEFRKAGDAEQAVMICEEFLPQQPGHMSGHIVYGQALFDLGRLDDARTVFETALTLDPENLIALRYLGDISRSHGDLESARHWYQRVLEADPRNEEVQGLVAALDASTPTFSTPAAAPAFDIDQSTTIDLAPAFESSEVAPAPLPATPPVPAESMLELDVVEEQVLDASPAAGAVEDPPFDSISLEGLEPTSAGAPPRPDDRAEGFEPMEFSPPPASTGTGSDIAGQLEPGEFTAPPTSVAPLDGLEETAIGAFEARPAPSAPPPLPDLEAALPDLEPAASDLAPSAELAASGLDELPVDLPPEVIAAEAELIDARDGLELPEMRADAPGDRDARAEEPAHQEEPARAETTPRVTPSQPFVTETMAELYVKQGFREQALDVYTLLLAASPESQRLRERVAELQPVAAADNGPNVREFFARLAARRPGERGASAVPPAADDFAAFDSFETVPSAEVAVSDEPREVAGLPMLDTTTPAHPAPSSTPEPTESGAGEGSIDALFGQRPVGSADDSAASALAQAFGSGTPEPPPITGRPARAAAGELSLDSVFRDGGARPPRSAQSFSFDQFFSESAASEQPGEASTTGTPSQGTGTQAEPPERSADDIEQFNSWLQGLKQK